MVKALVWSVALYGSETWHLEKKTLNVYKLLRCGSGARWRKSAGQHTCQMKKFWVESGERTMLSGARHQATSSQLDRTCSKIWLSAEDCTSTNANKDGVSITWIILLVSILLKRKTNRWSHVLFFNVTDVAAIAAHVVRLCSFPNCRIQKRHHHFYLQALGEALVDD